MILMALQFKPQKVRSNYKILYVATIHFQCVSFSLLRMEETLIKNVFVF